MKWVEDGVWPSEPEWEQIAILSAGLVATVLSWDGYLVSIGKKPLHGDFRFIIDIFLVFIYMFLLITSSKPDFWLPILALIFVLYTIWDALTVREHMGHYDRTLLPPEADHNYRATCSDVIRVYWGGLLSRTDTSRGPIITLAWMIHFVMLALLNGFARAKGQVFVICLLGIVSLLLYRHDKRTNSLAGTKPSYSMVARASIIAGLLLITALYFCVFNAKTSA
jgi:hypothetical protein